MPLVAQAVALKSQLVRAMLRLAGRLLPLRVEAQPGLVVIPPLPVAVDRLLVGGYASSVARLRLEMVGRWDSRVAMVS